MEYKNVEFIDSSDEKKPLYEAHLWNYNLEGNELKRTISKDNLEKILNDLFYYKLIHMFEYVWNNRQSEHNRLKGLLLTGGSCRLIGMKKLIIRCFSEVIERQDKRFIEGLVKQSKYPTWDVVRGAALVSYGLNRGKSLVDFSLRENSRISCNNISWAGRDIERNTSLPHWGHIIAKINEPTSAINLNVDYSTQNKRESDSENKQEIIIRSVDAERNDGEIERDTFVLISYRMGRDQLLSVQSYQTWPKIRLRLEGKDILNTKKYGPDLFKKYEIPKKIRDIMYLLLVNVWFRVKVVWAHISGFSLNKDIALILAMIVIYLAINELDRKDSIYRHEDYYYVLHEYIYYYDIHRYINGGIAIVTSLIIKKYISLDALKEYFDIKSILERFLKSSTESESESEN